MKFEDIHHKAKVFFHAHKTHCLSGLAIVVLVIHYVMPDFEAHATCIVGVICTELSS